MLGFLTREERLAIIDKPNESGTSQGDHLLIKMLAAGSPRSSA